MKSTSVNPLHTIIAPGLLCVLAIGFLIEAENFDTASRGMPQLIGRAMLLLAALDALSRTNTSLGGWLARLLNPGSPLQRPDAPSIKGLKAKVRLLLYMSWVLVFVAGLIVFGILVATPLFLLISLAVIGRRRIAESLFITVGINAFIWGLFAGLLHLNLFQGILFGGRV